MPDQLRQACQDFRDNVLHQQCQLADNGMTNDQVNDVLSAYDDTIGAVLEEQSCDHPWHSNPGLITPCPECGEGDEESDSITEDWFREEIGGGAYSFVHGNIMLEFDGRDVLAFARHEQVSLFPRMINIPIATFTTKTAVRQFCDSVGIPRKTDGK